VKRHTECINDLAFLGTTGTLYSVSKDKHLILTEMNRVDTYFIEEKIFTHELTGIILDKENKRIFVSDAQGSIHIYSLESKRVRRLSVDKRSLRPKFLAPP
jgi:WD40 repeat protein